MRIIVIFALALLGIENVSSRTVKNKDTSLSLSIIHTNDIHAHFDQVNVLTGRCHTEQAESNQCYGGMSRMFSAIKQLQEEDPDHTLTLNAGDYFQGTMWFSKLGYEPIVTFSNMLNWTAMALGNHEFDHNTTELSRFSKQVNYDLLASNLIESDSMEEKIKYSASKVMEVDGRRIGIIGYITARTPDVTSPDLPQLSFTEEVESVRNEARRLKALQDPVDILIALGHAGYQEVDLALAAEVEELDLVVGGHSHSFLYTGTPTKEMVEPVEGDYPTYVTQPTTGRVVPVVQVYKYSKYLGYLKMNFDDSGELVHPVDGSGISRADVILLDSTYPQDPWVEEKLDGFRDRLSEFYPRIGWSKVLLETKKDNTEQNLGNLIADSMVENNVWGDINIALINDGGIRASIIPGEITAEDLISVLPFGSTIDRVIMNGSSIRRVLEDYATGHCFKKVCDSRTFLQMSGIKVEYDIWLKQERANMTSLLTKCPEDTENWCEVEKVNK